MWENDEGRLGLKANPTVQLLYGHEFVAANSDYATRVRSCPSTGRAALSSIRSANTYLLGVPNTGLSYVPADGLFLFEFSMPRFWRLWLVRSSMTIFRTRNSINLSLTLFEISPWRTTSFS